MKYEDYARAEYSRADYESILMEANKIRARHQAEMCKKFWSFLVRWAEKMYHSPSYFYNDIRNYRRENI